MDIAARSSRTPRVARWAAGLAAVATLASCGGESMVCTLVAVDDAVFVDLSALPDDVRATAEICLDDECEPANLGGGVLAIAAVEGRELQRSLSIRSETGEVLAGPRGILLEVVEPNGEGCGEVIQGRYQVTADGELEASDGN